jgi:DNA-binding GntR family transcriptional regulator
LLADIFHGRLLPGQHLVTRELAERFGVSHTPIREALIALSGLGLLDLSPNRGAVVRRVAAQEVHDVIQVRQALECEAARSACGRIDPAALKAIAQDLRRQAAGKRGPAAGRAREVDSRLHDLIASACGNAFLAKELSRLKTLFRAFRDLAWDRAEAANDLRRIAVEAKEHLAIVSALEAGDAAGAARAMSRHIRSGLRHWKQALEEALHAAAKLQVVAPAPSRPRAPGNGVRRPVRIAAGAVLICGALGLLAGALRAADPVPLYNRDVRPILLDNCFPCHGPDSASRKADLRLDRRQAAIESKAFVPGKPEESELIRRIFATAPDDVMPPPVTKKTLSAAQKETLRRWIASGAEYQAHWSFIAPKRPPIPAVSDGAWVRSPIDAFILAALDARGLRPAPEADRRTLARRLSFDLTGLPPSPELVEDFLADASPSAYERLVDRLMSSPKWGEHRGRYWLDAARYADTHGIHFDNYREMWSYREWVIRALNQNMPFDRFTLEQLAGDLVESPTLDQQIASGFNRCNMTTNEGGAIAEEYLVYYTRDRTETTSQVWLGLTANCAVCHDHKFDPLSQREFYAMSAFFNNTTQAAMDGNIKDTPPIVVVPLTKDRTRWDALPDDIALARKQIDDRREEARGAFDAWLSAGPAEELRRDIPVAGLETHAALNEGQGNSVLVKFQDKDLEFKREEPFTWADGGLGGRALQTKPGKAVEVAGAGDFERTDAFTCGAWVRFDKAPKAGAILARMEDGDAGYRGWDIWVENGRVASHVVSHWQDDAMKVVSKEAIPEGRWTHVLLTYDGSSKAAGLKIYLNGRATETTPAVDALKGTIKNSTPFKVGQRKTEGRIDDLRIEDVRIYRRALSPQDAESLVTGTRLAALAAKPAEQRTADEVKDLFDGWLASRDAPYQERSARLAGLDAEKAAIASRGTLGYVMHEKPEEAKAFVLYRGEYDQRKDAVQPATPASLPAMPADYPRNRLGFARWLLRPENPLPARVTVNRFWQEVFGVGIVKTSGDFGVTGDLPSHPELLDWLAVEFRESGWDVKGIVRQLVTSSTYRQAFQVTDEKMEKDPQNRLLSRGPRFRMDAEMIRDTALATSGLLVDRIGGASVKPYQPDGIWEAVAMMESNTRYYKRDSGASLYRRSLYTFWKRAAPPASMDILNAPNREICTVRRERTNTPLQALLTLNDPQFVEAARCLAARSLREGGKTCADRAQYMAARLLARPLRPEELAVVESGATDYVQHYRGDLAAARELVGVGETTADPQLDPAELAAYTMVANELMNLDEVLNK